MHYERKIRAGVCSYGMSGKLFHAPFLQAHPGFSLDAIVERNREESRERYPAATLYRSVEDLCADPAIELIVVNTPTYLHYEQALLVLQAGKHLVIEKPFTITVAEAETLTALAKSKNCFVSVYQNRRYDGDYRAIKNVLDNGWLGEIKEAEFRFDRYRTSFSGKQHKEGNLPGAGILFDLSPHIADQALQLFGTPNAVFADLLKMRDDVEAPDYFEILLYYPRMRVRLKATCIARESTYAYVLHGMKGSFLQQRSDLQEQQLLAGVTPSLDNWCTATGAPDGILHAEINGEWVRKETTATPGNYMQYYDEVYAALTGQGFNPVPPEQAIRNMRIIEAAQQSAATGSIINC